jgi:hypothetical protein
LAKVRSAIALTIALVPLLAAAPACARVTVVLVPQGTPVERLAAAGMSPGLMSAGLGSVPAEQTYLDITQGNRVFDSLYDSPLVPARVELNRPVRDPAIVRRAESAPADIVPGLLGSTLAASGEGFRVVEGPPRVLGGLVAALRGNDLLVAIERPPPAANEALAIGIAGRGFGGNLTSDSTRMDGYVLSTDVAPTILGRLGVDAPAEMSGRPVRAGGEVDPSAVTGLGARMSVISERRGPVIGFSLLAWIAGLALAVAIGRRRAARPAVRVAGLAVVMLPLVLLAGAALEPSEPAEALLAMLGTPLLAAALLASLGGYRALAAGAALTVLAYAVDVVAGSPLTSLSLLGPNPGLGVRFYGIGNELEALLAVLVVAGTGAALAGFAPRLEARRCAALFLAVGFLAAAVFAAGRFGADVGAAIVLPFGAAVAAAVVSGTRGGRVLVVLAVPLGALALLAAADLVSGGDAHLTRSVLDAGGPGDLAEVAQRRLELSSHSFSRPVVYVFLPVIAVLAALAVARRDAVCGWVAGRPAMRAGLLGGLAAILAGTLANDSGALVLEIGAAYLLVFTGFAWAEAGP